MKNNNINLEKGAEERDYLDEIPVHEKEDDPKKNPDDNIA